MEQILEYKKLDTQSLTRTQFAQMVEIERHCGLEPYTPEMLLDCVENLDTFACLADYVIVGFITIQSRSRYLGGSLYIVNLNVAKAYRGQGVAKRLMYTVYEHYIREYGDMLVSLDVEKTNKAMELYRKIGFQVADMPSRNGDTDVVMAMSLTELGARVCELIRAEQYLRNPCRAASIPYWKEMGISVPENMKILHEDDFCPKLLEQYVDEPYFRLKHDLQDLTPRVVPDGYSLCEASIEEFAEHIGKCYDDIGVTAAELGSYAERVVYCPELWLALRDDASGEIAATGIGELDPEMGEGVLEWIQVSQAHRGRGLGSWVVSQLLWRMKGKAKFATVSGRCGNLSNPEVLYRRCGFTGSDIWHVLRKRESL